VSIIDAGDDVSIVVSDNGRGFPKGDSETLFTRFARDRLSSGFGIGLSLARWVIEQHGGNIVIEKDQPPLAGSRVIMTMPQAC
jgi:signal transduction histidine kinase